MVRLARCKDVDQQAERNVAVSDTKSDIKILALVGSLRAASFNRQIAELAAKVAPDGVTVTMFEGLGTCRSTTKTSTQRRRCRRR